MAWNAWYVRLDVYWVYLPRDLYYLQHYIHYNLLAYPRWHTVETNYLRAQRTRRKNTWTKHDRAKMKVKGIRGRRETNISHKFTKYVLPAACAVAGGVAPKATIALHHCAFNQDSKIREGRDRNSWKFPSPLRVQCSRAIDEITRRKRETCSTAGVGIFQRQSLKILPYPNGEETTANAQLSLWSLRLAYLIYNHELFLHWNCPTCLRVQSSFANVYQSLSLLNITNVYKCCIMLHLLSPRMWTHTRT